MFLRHHQASPFLSELCVWFLPAASRGYFSGWWWLICLDDEKALPCRLLSLLYKRISKVWHSYITAASSCAEQAEDFTCSVAATSTRKRNSTTNCFNLLMSVSQQRRQTQEGPAVLWMDRSMCSYIFTELHTTCCIVGEMENTM